MTRWMRGKKVTEPRERGITAGVCGVVAVDDVDAGAEVVAGGGGGGAVVAAAVVDGDIDVVVDENCDQNETDAVADDSDGGVAAEGGLTVGEVSVMEMADHHSDSDDDDD